MTKAQVISVVQEKGGAGKTTLLTVLASLMAADGAKVAVIDTDPQRHLEKWAGKENTKLDWHFEDNDSKLIDVIQALQSQDYDVIFIDTAGFKSVMSTYAIAVASLVLIPSKASEADAQGAIKTYEQVRSVGKIYQREIPAYVVMSDIDRNTNMTKSLVEGLEGQGMPMVDAALEHRTGFKEMLSTGAMPTGSALTSAKSLMANMQINKLIDYYGG